MKIVCTSQMILFTMSVDFLFHALRPTPSMALSSSFSLFTSSNFRHKKLRRRQRDETTKCSKACWYWLLRVVSTAIGIQTCYLLQADASFFNHSIIHSFSQTVSSMKRVWWHVVRWKSSVDCKISSSQHFCRPHPPPPPTPPSPRRLVRVVFHNQR